jgi:hypothetical protein
MAGSIYAYFKRCIDFGAFEGGMGVMKINKDLAPLIEGIHRVLAGGSVEVTVKTPGSPLVYNELRDRFEHGLEDANRINAAAGYYVSLGP